MPDLSSMYRELGELIVSPPTEGEYVHQEVDLGAFINGVRKVKLDNDNSRFYISFSNGTYTTALHYGRVGPVDGATVVVKKIPPNDYEILNSSPTRGQGQSNITDVLFVPEHHHGRGNTYEDAIDPRQLTQLRVAISSGLNVYITPGYYSDRAIQYWWSDITPFSLSGYRPATAGNWALGIIGLDPSTDPATPVVVMRPQQIISVPINMDDLKLIDFESLGYIPLSAIVLTNGQSILHDTDFTALYALAHSASSPGTGTTRFEPLCFNSEILFFNGDVLMMEIT